MWKWRIHLHIVLDEMGSNDLSSWTWNPPLLFQNLQMYQKFVLKCIFKGQLK